MQNQHKTLKSRLIADLIHLVNHLWGYRPAPSGAGRQSEDRDGSLLDEVTGVEVPDRNRQNDSRTTRHVERDGGGVELGHDESVVNAEEQPQVVVVVHEPPVRNGRAVQMNAHASGRLNGRTGRLGHEELLLRGRCDTYIL